LISGFLSACQPSRQHAGGPPAASSDSAAADSVPAASAAPNDSTDAANVIPSYYQAIAEGRYEDAYHHWGSGGTASGKTLEEFRSGFSETADVQATIGSLGPMEGAAGSRYIEVPVHVVAHLRSGAQQQFEGTYTLRRSVVDGATPEQQTWHIVSAKISQVK